jgi:hypothetical protein
MRFKTQLKTTFGLGDHPLSSKERIKVLPLLPISPAPTIIAKKIPQILLVKVAASQANTSAWLGLT